MPLLNCSVPQYEAGHAKTNFKDASLSCEVGVVHGSSGSAYIDTGGASVMCSVHGPSTAQRGAVEGVGLLECSTRYAPFTSRPKASETPGESAAGGNQMTTFEKYLSQMAKDGLERSVRLELYPKMVISLAFVVLKSSGNTGTDLAAIITCGSLALVDALIETIDIVTSSSVGVSAVEDASPQFVLEPTSSSTINGSLTIAILPSLQEISHLYCEGKIDSELMPLLVSTARSSASSLRDGIVSFYQTGRRK